MESENKTCVKGTSLKKKALIVLLALVCGVAISVTSVLTTVAYLTSSAAVSNVFTIGNVGIKMTESKVDADGQIITGEGAMQVDTNTYTLVPGKTYDKDPKITVDAGSQDSFLFVLVRNDIELIAANTAEHPSIAKQMAMNGWAKYVQASTGWVYVYVGETEATLALLAQYPTYNYTEGGVAKTHTAKEVKPGTYELFSTFTIAPNADVSVYGAAKITLTAVAIQDAGFEHNIGKAWEEVKKAYPYIHTGGDPTLQNPTSKPDNNTGEGEGEGTGGTT